MVLGEIGGGFRLPGSETSLRFYGYAEAHAIHDLKQPGPSDTFTDLMFQLLDNSGGQKGKTKFTAQTSRFGFESSTPTSIGAFNTKVEMDFYSYGSGSGSGSGSGNRNRNRNRLRLRLRLRHAYGEYAGFLVGQTWSTFMDLDDLPETVDFNGPIGAPLSRRTMIRTPMPTRRPATSSPPRSKIRKTSSAVAAPTRRCRRSCCVRTRASTGAHSTRVCLPTKSARSPRSSAASASASVAATRSPTKTC